MEQTSITNQQVNPQFPNVVILSNTKDILEQDYASYDVVVPNEIGWLEFFRQTYNNSIENCLILPPGYNFTYSNVLKTMMAHTPMANNNPLILYGDHQVKNDEYTENVYLPTMNQGNNSIQFLQGVPLLIYRNDILQTEAFKDNIYQIFNLILSIHIPQLLFCNTA